MVLDINLFRSDKGADPEVVRESQRKRGAKVELVDEVIELDKKWVKLEYDASQLRKRQNQLSKDFGKAKKEGAPTDDLAREIEAVKAQIADLQAQEKETLAKRDAVLFTIGNLIPPEVPVSCNEDDNVVRAAWDKNKLVTQEKLNNHIVCFQRINGTDTVRGTKCAGGRGYFLSGAGCLLNQALISYA